MRYYVIAGEASGDLHGSRLIRAINELDQQAVVRCWGGDKMAAEGAEVVKHYRDLAFMGFAEVIKNLPTILRNIKWCKQDILAFKPDVLVLIDYPGFNLRIAKWAKDQGIKVAYYISPQVWAWKQSRVKAIREVVDKMLVILPFEQPFYKQWDYEVEYVGHPLAEIVNEELKKPFTQLKTNQPITASKPIIALLPGSRAQEIRMKLPLMLEASQQFSDYQFVVAQAPAQPTSFYQTMISGYPDVRLALTGETYNLLKQSQAALVTSGTATLETALFGVPQVVCYKGSWLSYQIAKRVVKVNYISLVNLIMDKPVVKELIQDELTVENIARELQKVTSDEQGIKRMKLYYAELKNLLHQNENASSKAAKAIYGLTTTSTTA